MYKDIVHFKPELKVMCSTVKWGECGSPPYHFVNLSMNTCITSNTNINTYFNDQLVYNRRENAYTPLLISSADLRE